MENRSYNLLYTVLKDYSETEWNELISNILDFKYLDLPVVLDSELPEETLVFLNTFLQSKSKEILDLYLKHLVDYYSTLNHSNTSIRKFKTLHWVFSDIKPTKYRYVLERKFTREDFINEFGSEVGEKLQLDLLSTISCIRYVNNEILSFYIHNRQHKYNSDSFILISLRYFQKTVEESHYFTYFEYLVSTKLNIKSASFFVEALKELVFQNKSYKSVYDWLISTKNISKKHFPLLKQEMLNWINYENRDILSNSTPYCEFIFFELAKEDIVPCYTLKRMISHQNQYQFITNDISKYFESFLNKRNAPVGVHSYCPYVIPFIDDILRNSDESTSNFKNLVLLFNKEFISTNETMSNEYLGKLSNIYKLNVNEIIKAELSENESLLMKFLKNRKTFAQ